MRKRLNNYCLAESGLAVYAKTNPYVRPCVIVSQIIIRPSHNTIIKTG